MFLGAISRRFMLNFKMNLLKRRESPLFISLNLSFKKGKQEFQWYIFLITEVRGESHIDFRTQSLIMTLGGRGVGRCYHWGRIEILKNYRNSKLINCHELSINLQCFSKAMNGYMSRTFFTKIRLSQRKTVLKVS